LPDQSAMLPAGPASSAARVVWDVCEQGQALLAVLFPHLAGLRVHRVEDAGDAVVIVASCRADSACCPRCGQESARVHGGYARVVADGAAGGRPVLIVLQVRRFRCRNPGCPAVTFAEQAGGLSERYRRRSIPLLAMLAGFGLELAGRAAARLAGTIGITVHPSTVLRLVAAAPEPEVTAAPEVLGVDDFALAKGYVYGTVLVDMRTGDVVDLLPDREAATLEAWLTAHPGAGIICRDRAGNYAEGARDGAPEAIQVADRWHLWHNLAEYAEKTVTRHRGCLQDPPAGGDSDGGTEVPGPADRPAQEPPGQAGAAEPPDGYLDACGRERRLVTRTRERYAEIRGRLDAGESLSAISRATRLDRKTVQRFARVSSAEELLGKATSRESKLDKFTPYLHQRWNEGVTEVVADQVHLEPGGHVLVDPGQELLELRGPVAAVQGVDHGAVGDVERGEQVGRAVPDIVVAAPLGGAGHHRQHRLGAVQRLDARFLVHAQHHRLLRRIVVQADDIDDLVHEQRVGGQLEGAG
jgi:zinc-finger of transposase IS204/IS1001/IS1096/IS1165/Transposase